MKYLFKNKIKQNELLTVLCDCAHNGTSESLDYHPHYEMYFCNGSLDGRVIINRTVTELSCPFICIYSPFTMHASIKGGTQGCISSAVYFRRTYWENFSSDVLPLDMSNKNIIFPLTESEAGALRAALSLLKSEDISEAEKATLFASFLNALCRIVPENKRIFICDTNETVSQILKYINANISDKLNADDVSKLFHISRAKLDRDLRTHVGTSFHKVVSQCRISMATDLLADSHYGISKIGAMVGFENPRGFYSFFKRYVGVSPAQYRGNSPQKRAVSTK